MKVKRTTAAKKKRNTKVGAKPKVYVSRLDRVNVKLPKAEKAIFQQKANRLTGGNITKLVRAAVLGYVPKKSA